MDSAQFFDFVAVQGYSNKELEILQIAQRASEEHLSKSLRKAGDSFYDHNLRVAHILAKTKAAPELLVAALVKKVDRVIPKQEFEKTFGSEVYLLIKEVESISNIKSKNPRLTATALRQVLLATVRDVRVILLKLADKLDNLRDLHALDKEDQQRIASEVLEIYAPLAYRLGVEGIRRELEDLAFENLHPQEYKEITDYLKSSEQQREEIISTTIAAINKGCDIPLLSIKGRSKHINSIYKKIVGRGLPLTKQYDLLGIRIIVNSVEEVYSVLAYLHEKYEPIPGRLKDYISNPKPNGYQSVHTGVLVPGGWKVELQIRTKEMDDAAEEGLAAHWRYKGVKSDANFETRMAWLKGVLDLQKDSSAREFLEAVTVDVFTDKIHCYTPKGDVRYLPKGATILDFAYSIHLDVGNTSIGARVNGVFVPLRSELSRGDVVEVLTSKKQRPRRNWLKWVKTSRAKQKIRKGLKEYQDLPAFHYRTFKPQIVEEHDSLVSAPDLGSAACVLAKCCQPIPGDAIVGIVTKKRLVSVHQSDCKLALKENHRWEAVAWKDHFSKKISFTVQAQRRSGLLADLLNTIVRAGFSVHEAKAQVVGTDDATCSFVIAPKPLEDIVDLVSRIKKLRGIYKLVF